MMCMPHPWLSHYGSVVRHRETNVPSRRAQLMFPSPHCSYQCSAKGEMLRRSWHTGAEFAYLWSNRAVTYRLIFEVVILERIFGIIQPGPCYCSEVQGVC